MRKRIVFVLLACSMVLSAPLAFAGSGVEATATATGKVNPAGVFPIVSEPTTFTFFREGNLTEDQLQRLSENGVLKYWSERTNINMKFIHLNPAEGKTKMILSFASDDYPDGGLLSWNTMFTRDDIMQYGVKEKILLPLNSYIDTYGIELKKIFDLRPNHRAILTAPDGNIYGIPRFTECYHCMSYPKLWFNYAWMEKLGLKEPQTTEELYQVLKAFKTRDPNGNGKADEIPLTGNVEWSSALEYYLMNSFIYTDAASTSTSPRPFLSWVDNKVTFVATRPEFKEGLTWMKKLYDEGLIDQGNFTQNNQSMQQVARAEPLLIGGYTSDHIGMGVDFWNNTDVTDGFNALPPVAGPNGVRYQPYWDPVSQIGGFNFVIFDKASNPEAIYRLADDMLSEYNMFVGHYGIEGIGWNPPKDPNAKNMDGGPLKAVPVVMPAGSPQADIDRLNNNRLWLGLIGDLRERRSMWSPEATPETLQKNYETRIEWETKKTEKYWPAVVLPRSLFMEKETGEEFAELKTNLVNLVLKNTAMFITGARNLSEWDAYVAEAKRFGVDRYVEIYSEAYAMFQKNMK